MPTMVVDGLLGYAKCLSGGDGRDQQFSRPKLGA